jgi:hypothetical protein
LDAGISGVQAAFSSVLELALSKLEMHPSMNYETDEQARQRIIRDVLRKREYDAIVASVRANIAELRDDNVELPVPRGWIPAEGGCVSSDTSELLVAGQGARTAESSATKAWAVWGQASGLIVQTSLLPRLSYRTGSSIPPGFAASLEGILTAFTTSNPPAELRQCSSTLALIGRHLWYVAVADAGTVLNQRHGYYEESITSREARASLALELLRHPVGQEVADLLDGITISEGGEPQPIIRNVQWGKEARLAYASNMTMVSKAKLANIFDAVLGATFLQLGQAALGSLCTELLGLFDVQVEEEEY